MKRHLILFFCVLFCLENTCSQNFIVSGNITDASTKKGLEYATIIFSPINLDSLDVIGGITDNRGDFKIGIKQGSYGITIEFLSYNSKVIHLDTIKSDIDLGTIELSQNIESLDIVSIDGNNSRAELKLDKKTYNVSKDILSNGGSATDVLLNVPSVTVSSEGTPIIRGRPAKVLVNGRISARGKSESLKNLPASSIQKIEVITTPSSRYSGDSSGGIINIILKKGLDNGFNGSITGSTTLGDSEIYGVATSLNYRKDKLNIYTNTSYFHRKPISNTKIENEYTTNGITDGYLTEDRKYIRKNVVFESTLGFDYYFNDYISLNIEGIYSKFNGDFSNNNVSSYLDASQTITLAKKRNIFTDHNNEIIEIAGVYTQYFDREGEIVYIEFSHSQDNEMNDSELFNEELFPNAIDLPNDDELVYDAIDVRNTHWFLAYDWPIDEKTILGFGYEANLGNVNNEYINEIIVDGDFEQNPLTSNTFEYTENWHRFYTQFDQNYEKFSFGVGLSIETTYLSSNLVYTNENNSQKYTDLFPSISFDYLLNENKSLTFKYRRGINRVNYPNLNPFEQRISETTSFIGNENLLPFYINAFELSLLNENVDQKLTINPTLYYKNYCDMWQYVTYENGEIINGVPKLITTPINLGNLNYLGMEFLSVYSPNEWLDLTGSLDVNFVKQDGIFEYTDSSNEIVVLDFNDTNFGGSLKLNTAIHFPKEYNFQALIEYDFPSEGAYSKREGLIYMNAALSKDILKKRATISFIADDIFDSNRTKRTRWTEDIISYSNRQWKDPSFMLSFTWRFNQSKKRKKIKFNQNDEETNF